MSEDLKCLIQDELAKSVLTCCKKFIPTRYEAEIDGIVCVSLGKQKPVDIVVKIHNKTFHEGSNAVVSQSGVSNLSNLLNAKGNSSGSTSVTIAPSTLTSSELANMKSISGSKLVQVKLNAQDPVAKELAASGKCSFGALKAALAAGKDKNSEGKISNYGNEMKNEPLLGFSDETESSSMDANNIASQVLKKMVEKSLKQDDAQAITESSDLGMPIINEQLKSLGQYVCNHANCGILQFRTVDGYCAHMKSTHMSYVCKFCVRVFKSSYNYTSHMKLHSRLEESLAKAKDMKLNCPTIKTLGSTGATSTTTSTTKQSQAGVKYRCGICDKKCNFKGSIYYHFKKYHGATSASINYCGKCGLYLLDKAQMNIHRKSCEGEANLGEAYSETEAMGDEGPYTCSHQNCKIECASILELREHIFKKHTNMPRYNCKVCNKYIEDENEFKSHFNTHRIKGQTGALECCFCGQSKDSIPNLILHQQSCMGNCAKSDSPESGNAANDELIEPLEDIGDEDMSQTAIVYPEPCDDDPAAKKQKMEDDTMELFYGNQGENSGEENEDSPFQIQSVFSLGGNVQATNLDFQSKGGRAQTNMNEGPSNASMIVFPGQDMINYDLSLDNFEQEDEQEPIDDDTSLTYSPRSSRSRKGSPKAKGAAKRKLRDILPRPKNSKREIQPLDDIESKASYTCDLCDISMKNFQDFNCHVVMTHRKVVCKFCARTFASQRNLRRHERGHTGEKPYKCKICGKSFTRDDKLKRHLQQHDDNKIVNYHCKYCDQTFSRVTDSLKHLQMAHKTKINTPNGANFEEHFKTIECMDVNGTTGEKDIVEDPNVSKDDSFAMEGDDGAKKDVDDTNSADVTNGTGATNEADVMNQDETPKQEDV
ncbi:unnamed protein product [Owenia fusiformis]|nr:unnamed protein product [Owenia fusiformis]